MAEVHGREVGLLFGDAVIETDDFPARVPIGISTKPELLAALQQVLELPDYFGANWDALEECLRDLSWLSAHRVVLLHGDIPLANDRAQASAYVAILDAAVAYWLHRGERRLVAMFPNESRAMIEDLLSVNRV